MMVSKVHVLDVKLYGDPIGTLTLVPGDRSLFAFNEDYIANEQRPTLSLSFKDEFGTLITETKPTQTSLSPFFANLLPEGHMREYLAKQASVKQMREFHLLWALGQDLPGAMTVSSAQGADWTVDDMEAGASAAKDKPEPTMRFSLAGVQMKFSAINEADGGLTIPVGGTGGSWIVKLPSSRYPGVPENEHAMMSLAKSVGIDVPRIKLINAAQIDGLPLEIERLEEPAFAIERFDRGDKGERIHIEDFAQIFSVRPNDKYKNATFRSLAHVLWMETGADGIEEFVRRLVFNTLIGNADMHLKNWSLIYRDRRTPSIAPAYDFVSTIAFLPDEMAALKFAKQKRMKDFGFDELKLLAAKAGAPETLVVKTAKSTVERFLDAWRAERMNLGLTKHMRDVIDAHYRATALFAETSSVARP